MSKQTTKKLEISLSNDVNSSFPGKQQVILKATYILFHCCLCCRKGDPFQGPKLGSCLTLRNELSEETHVLTKQEILLGKGTLVESSR